MAGVDLTKSRDRKRQFHDVLKLASDLSHTKDRIESLQAQSDDAATRRHRQIEQLSDTARRSITNERSLIEDALARLDTILAGRRAQAGVSYPLPTIESIREQTQRFFDEKQPIIPAPYAFLCGAIPFPDDQIIPNGSFVCARNPETSESDDAQYILAYVIGFDPEKFTYHVCDADPELTILADIEVPANLVVPMPISVPARRTKSSSHAVRTTVLALWQEDGGTWTTVFYRATVVSLPTTSPGCYGLRFEGDYTAMTPERYVVRSPTQEQPGV
jgi:hypothetical protein